MMQLFTELGIDTGFKKGLTFKDKDAGGNYEKRLRGGGVKHPLPYVIKEPQMCADIDLRIEKLNLNVDMVYVLLRRPGPESAALEFMRRNAGTKGDKFERGLNGDTLERVTAQIAKRELQVVHLLAELDVPHTLVSYPRFGHDYAYSFSKFSFMWEKHGISKKAMKEVWKRVVDDDQIKHAYDVQPEWNRAKMREIWKFRALL